MPKDDNIRLRHMLEAAREATAFSKNKTRESLDSDRQLVRALEKSIEILGEAAVHVTEKRRHGLQGIPWKNIVGMRNHLIHAYFDINLDILWKTIVEDLPPLISELEKVSDELVCYCFGYSRKDIETDFIQHHRSLILEKIAAEKKAGGCDCAHKNPKGR
jgi:uncharacterized protein with HEPN domain